MPTSRPLFASKSRRQVAPPHRDSPTPPQPTPFSLALVSVASRVIIGRAEDSSTLPTPAIVVCENSRIGKHHPAREGEH
ncbi:hypothetical protein ACFFQF_02805 [Haladaptatus pallidirubidus]|uniref:hypothetical protein n=1 Tax=Haladaptatus pallidirubidus TaxID=1008152 RepID=UPI001D12F0E8|nr:hypothetical protein [Haladaptatus pallidirubidus]